MSTHEDILHSMTMEQLVGLFEVTEHINDKYISIVRGWLMDEIENRNPEGLDAWLDSENPVDTQLRNYVL